MTVRIAHAARKVVAVTGLTAALSVGGLGLGLAERPMVGNFYADHPGPAAGRTDVDRFDPYAPVDLGAGTVTGGGLQLLPVGDPAATVVGMPTAEDQDHCTPQRCAAW